MKVGDKVKVSFSRGILAGRTLTLDVEEFQPIEPSAYAWVAGWNCAVEIAGESVWFFIDEAGSVWDEGNDEVGLCDSQERAYAKLCAEEN